MESSYRKVCRRQIGQPIILIFLVISLFLPGEALDPQKELEHYRRGRFFSYPLQEISLGHIWVAASGRGLVRLTALLQAQEKENRFA